MSGVSVSLSSDGTIVAIGALYNDGNGPDAGHVRVYEINFDSDGDAELLTPEDLCYLILKLV